MSPDQAATARLADAQQKQAVRAGMGPIETAARRVKDRIAKARMRDNYDDSQVAQQRQDDCRRKGLDVWPE